MHNFIYNCFLKSLIEFSALNYYIIFQSGIEFILHYYFNLYINRLEML